MHHDDYKSAFNEFLGENVLDKVKAEGTKEQRTIIANLIRGYRKAIRQSKILDNLRFFGGCMITACHYYMNEHYQMLDLTNGNCLWELGEFWIKFKVYIKKCEDDYYFSSVVPCNIKNNDHPITQFSKSYKEGFHIISERKLLELVTNNLLRFNVELIID